MKRLQSLILLLTLVTMVLLPQSCTTESSHAHAYIKEVEAQVEDLDHAPSDSLALQVVTYMEMYGTPEERLQAWRLAGKMYHRMDNNSYWSEAYRMAVGSIDTTQAFDTLLLATTLSEYAEALSATHGLDQARQQADRAIRLAEEMGDSVHTMYLRALNFYWYLDFDMAWSAHDYLWAHGHRQLAEDCIFPALLLTSGNDQYLEDLNRFAQYTSYNIEHPQSLRARQFWKQKADAFEEMGERDSCLYYRRKFADADQHRYEGANGSGYRDLFFTFSNFGQQDSVNHYRQLWNETEKASSVHKTERQGQMLERVYQSLRTQMEQVEEAHRQRTAIIVVIIMVIVFVFVFVFVVLSRQRTLRRQHQQLLQQNAEYVAMLSSLQSKDKLQESAIVKRIHALSSRDARPSDEEWQQLYQLIDQQYPQLFPTLNKDYTLTEQETHAICLMVAKCTPSQMCVLMVYTRGGISNLRRRIYQKVTQKDGSGPDLDELVNRLCG